MSRSQKTLFNTLAGLVEEVIAVICCFILPRLILTTFGSEYNGLSTSITQFLSCAVLLRSGVGGATRAALYKPLAEGDKNKISSIIKATDNYMKKVSLILAGLIFILAVIYPFFVSTEFDWFFTFSLFLIIGVSSFAESFFGVTYHFLLQADQRQWVSSFARSICYIVNTLVSVFLIRIGCSIHIVKLGSAFVYVVYPIILRAYVQWHYQLNKNAEPDNTAIAQRWDAFWQQVAVFVMNNTDVMVLTVFSNLLEVSVYSVYNLVVSGLRRIISALTNGLEAPLGDMIANGESSALKSNLEILELTLHTLCTIIYTSAILLIFQFINIYTKDILDVDYIRPIFAYIIFIAQFFNGIRSPYQAVTFAAGHYKQTRNGAIIEPVLNILISVILVIKFGLVGVAVGTLVATIFRTVQYSVYVCKNIVPRNQLKPFLMILTSFIEGIVIIAVVRIIPLPTTDDYFIWAINAVIVVCIATIIVFAGNAIFYRSTFRNVLKKVKGMVGR